MQRMGVCKRSCSDTPKPWTSTSSERVPATSRIGELQGENPPGGIAQGDVGEEGEHLRRGDVHEGCVAEDISTEDAGERQVVKAHGVELGDPVQQLPETLIYACMYTVAVLCITCVCCIYYIERISLSGVL